MKKNSRLGILRLMLILTISIVMCIGFASCGSENAEDVDGEGQSEYTEEDVVEDVTISNVKTEKDWTLVEEDTFHETDSSYPYVYGYAIVSFDITNNAQSPVNVDLDISGVGEEKDDYDEWVESDYIMDCSAEQTYRDLKAGDADGYDLKVGETKHLQYTIASDYSAFDEETGKVNIKVHSADISVEEIEYLDENGGYTHLASSDEISVSIDGDNVIVKNNTSKYLSEVIVYCGLKCTGPSEELYETYGQGEYIEINATYFENLAPGKEKQDEEDLAYQRETFGSECLDVVYVTYIEDVDKN